MVHYMLVRHRVRDFSEWKKGYDAHLTKRVEAGLTERHLLHEDQDLRGRDPDDANRFGARGVAYGARGGRSCRQ